MKKPTICKVQNTLNDWYKKTNRELPWRKTRDPYLVWISEVMLQQTRIETVIPYYKRFVSQFPEVKHLAEAELQTVLKLWEGLGYYARARNMHRTAKIICEEHEGKLPENRKALLLLPGIGDYISAALASIAFQIPVAVVDGNVKRVLARLFMDPLAINDTAAKKHFETLAQQILDKDHPGEFNQAVMELGQRICKPKKPVCRLCPINELCKAYLKNQIEQYPKQIPKQAIPIKKMIFGIVLQKKNCLLLKRADNGLLGGLWEFPGDEKKQSDDSRNELAEFVYRNTGIQIKVIRKLGSVRHAYTHFKVTADIFLCHHHSGKVHLQGFEDHKWIQPEEIRHFPCHKLIHKMLPFLHGI